MATFTPPTTDADEGGLADAAGELEALAGSVTGAGDQLHSDITLGAEQFSENIAPSIRGKGAEAYDACLSVVQQSSYGASIVSLMSEDVSDFKSKIATLQAQWDMNPTSALHLSPEEFEAQREALANRLNSEAKKAFDELEDNAEERGSQLSEGATEANIRDAVAGGGMSWWIAWSLWGAETAGEPPADFQREEGQRIADLLAGTYDQHNAAGGVSEENLAHINNVLAALGMYAHFSTSLVQNLGGQGIVNASAVIGASNANGDAINRFQQVFGNALAVGGDPNNGVWKGENDEKWNEWIDGVMDAGAGQVVISFNENHEVRATGYNALAPLLAYADQQFAPAFLVPVTEHMIRLDNDPTFDLTDQPASASNVFDPTGQLGRNPIDGALIALDNSPEAATALLSDQNDMYSRVYKLNGEVLMGVDNLTYLLDQNSYPPFDPDLVGNAVQAASTGLSSDDIANGEPPRHTGDMVRVTEQLMKYVADNPEAFTSPTDPNFAMIDNFANIATNYMADIYKMYLPDGDNPWAPESHGVELLLSPYDGTANKADPALEAFLQAIGHHKDATIQFTEHASEYTQAVYHAAVGDVLPIGNGGTESGEAARAATPFGHMMGDIADGQTGAVTEQKVAAADRHNANVNLGKTAASLIYSNTLGRVDAPIVSPHARVSGFVFDKIFNSQLEDPAQEISAATDEIDDKNRSGIDAWLEESFEANGLELSEEDRDEWITQFEQAVFSGYNAHRD